MESSNFFALSVDNSGKNNNINNNNNKHYLFSFLSIKNKVAIYLFLVF